MNPMQAWRWCCLGLMLKSTPIKQSPQLPQHNQHETMVAQELSTSGTYAKYLDPSPGHAFLDHGIV